LSLILLVKTLEDIAFSFLEKLRVNKTALFVGNYKVHIAEKTGTSI
jgi:hypothetical protein